jgi:hypothetical protein
VINDGDISYLLLKPTTTINAFNQDSLKACFNNIREAHFGKRPEIRRPAIVRSSGGQWQLVEKGAFA